MATIKDVAEKAGVSIGTVDRIIHKRGRFSQDTAKRVEEAIRELNYTTNIQARNLSLSKKCHIAVLMPFPEQDSEYWNIPYNGMKAAVSELSTSNLSASFFHYDRYDFDTLLSAVSRMSQEDFDAYVAAPLIRDEFLEAYRELFESKPVVFFDTDIDNSKRMTYIGQDSLDAGHLAAKLIRLLQKDSGEILITSPAAENEHLQKRIQGFTERIARPYELIEIPPEHDIAVKTYNSIRTQLGSRFSAVYVIDSSSHNIAQIIEEDDLKEKVSLVGYDLVPRNVYYLRRKMIDFILTQRPFEQGYMSIQCLYQKVLLGLDIAERNLMPIDIITRENMESYLGSIQGMV